MGQAPLKVASAKVIIVSSQVCRRLGQGEIALMPFKLNLQGRWYAPGQFILNSENIVQLEIILLSPHTFP